MGAPVEMGSCRMGRNATMAMQSWLTTVSVSHSPAEGAAFYRGNSTTASVVPPQGTQLSKSHKGSLCGSWIKEGHREREAQWPQGENWGFCACGWHTPAQDRGDNSASHASLLSQSHCISGATSSSWFTHTPFLRAASSLSKSCSTPL